MKTINSEEFLEILYSNKDNISISNYIIDFSTLFIDFKKVKTKNPIFFQNLTFTGKYLNFNNETEKIKITILIENCTFNTNVGIKGDFEDISFRTNTFNCDKFEISNSEIGVLEFCNHDAPSPENTKKNIFNKGNLKIENCDFKSAFWFKNVEFMENTTFDISSVRFLEVCCFDFTSLNKIQFYNCDFFKEFRYDCNYNSSQFRECNFLDKSIFLGLFNADLSNSFLWFDDCFFSKLANFNGYFVHKLRIEDTTFQGNVSLQKTYFNIITIVRTVFEKKVWFENIQINQIYNCDIETIRTIKQELQKAENRIDYNRFRAYELAAHYEELNYKENFKDVSILWATKWSSNYGSWTWALGFILLIDLGFFSSYFILENMNKSFNLSNLEDFLYGYFRFFLITDFKNEYYQDGESILKFNCFVSLIPFVIGKIAVAFGIYEMIQSFRKFKA